MRSPGWLARQADGDAEDDAQKNSVQTVLVFGCVRVCVTDGRAVVCTCRYGYSGQKCSAQSILFVHKNWADRGFLDHIRERVCMLFVCSSYEVERTTGSSS